MPYPVAQPTSRSYDFGNWPVKTFNAQNGTEIRLLYGSRRTNLQLQLGYQNVPDAKAAEFMAHYEETKGTYLTFAFSGAARVALFAGWTGTAAQLDAAAAVEWRYAKAPTIDSVRPGISTVQVSLVGVI